MSWRGGGALAPVSVVVDAKRLLGARRVRTGRFGVLDTREGRKVGQTKMGIQQHCGYAGVVSHGADKQRTQANIKK